MALWMLRGGKHDEDVPRFLSEGRVFPGWGQDLREDLGKLSSKEDYKRLLERNGRLWTKMKLAVAAGQLNFFVKRMKVGDWVVVPNRSKAAIHIGELNSEYQFDQSAANGPFHFRDVKWMGMDIPRATFDQDLLYSFGGLATIYQIKRNDAEARVRKMAASGWKNLPIGPKPELSGEDEADEPVDYERLARDQIANLVIRKFKGHGLARLVESVLRAQGYTTFLSPPGPDKGIDILCAPGPLGFGKPRICVQVKSSDSPVDTPTVSQLIGTMQNVQAEQGLLVSWGGFKSSVDKEIPSQFFRVRLWDQEALINELLTVYDKLDEDLRAEIPVKKIWSLAAQDDEE